MAMYKTTGLVLRRHNFGEADRIVTLLTPDRGKLRVVAKGIRRIKSRMAGHLELFSRSQLMLVEGRNLDIITSARLQHYQANGWADYERVRLAYLVAEIIEKLTSDEGDPQPELFALASQFYELLEANTDLGWLELVFKLQLANHLGYRPELSVCRSCGRGGVDNEYFFSPTLGGIVDASCLAGSLAVSMPHNQIKLWRWILAQSRIIAEPPGGTSELLSPGLAIINSFYDEVFGRRFKVDQILI